MHLRKKKSTMENIPDINLIIQLLSQQKSQKSIEERLRLIDRNMQKIFGEIEKIDYKNERKTKLQQEKFDILLGISGQPLTIIVDQKASDNILSYTDFVKLNPKPQLKRLNSPFIGEFGSYLSTDSSWCTSNIRVSEHATISSLRGETANKLGLFSDLEPANTHIEEDPAKICTEKPPKSEAKICTKTPIEIEISTITRIPKTTNEEERKNSTKNELKSPKSREIIFKKIITTKDTTSTHKTMDDSKEEKNKIAYTSPRAIEVNIKIEYINLVWVVGESTQNTTTESKLKTETAYKNTKKKNLQIEEDSVKKKKDGEVTLKIKHAKIHKRKMPSEEKLKVKQTKQKPTTEKQKNQKNGLKFKQKLKTENQSGPTHKITIERGEQPFSTFSHTRRTSRKERNYKYRRKKIDIYLQNLHKTLSNLLYELLLKKKKKKEEKEKGTFTQTEHKTI